MSFSLFKGWGKRVLGKGGVGLSVTIHNKCACHHVLDLCFFFFSCHGFFFFFFLKFLETSLLISFSCKKY